MLTRIYGTAFFEQKDLEDVSAPARGGAPPRSPPARRPARPVPLLRDLAGLAVLAPEGDGDLERADGLWREQNARAATARCARRSCSTSTLWKRSGHWDNYRENMFFSRGRRARVRPEADELPGPRRDLQPHAAQLPRPAAAAAPSRAWCIATRRRARCTGLLRVRHITQDDAHIFCTWEQVEDEVIGCLRARRVHLRDARAARPGRALDAARQADRQRGAVGSHGGSARRRRSRAPAGTIESTRATGRSTRRRSTCT